MASILSETESTFEIPSADVHSAVCCEFVDLGEQQSPWGPKTQGVLLFQVHERDSEGRQKEVRVYFTMTLGTSTMKSKVRKLLESWRGTPFTGDELKGFDIEQVVGKQCRVLITHAMNQKDQVTARIGSILKAAPGITVHPEAYKPWAERKQKEGAPADIGTSGAAGGWQPEDDDIPF